MRKLAAIGLAGVLATASVGATTQSAHAWGGGQFVAGLLIGGAVVALLHHHQAFAGTRTFGYAPVYTPTYPTVTYGFVADSHVAKCQARYKTYNVTTDTFIGNDRRPHRCMLY